jgi:hypothetical protein
MSEAFTTSIELLNYTICLLQDKQENLTLRFHIQFRKLICYSLIVTPPLNFTQNLILG